jgi:hypothetical protein
MYKFYHFKKISLYLYMKIRFMLKLKKLFSLLFLLLICITADAQTYKDIAPILNKNCTGCHNQGAAVFSLANYSSIKPHGETIKEVVSSGYMPPWPPDATYKNFARERLLSESDKAKLISWIDAELPAGDTTLAPKAPVFSRSQLKGTPDLIIKVPKFKSTSTTKDKYICLNVPTGLTKDRYIRAFEYIPGNAEIIHHAVLTIDTTRTAVDDLTGDCYNFQGQIGIGDYAPGRGPTVLPGVPEAKFGFRLPANSLMSFQIHVPEGTAGQEDESELHLFFYKEGEQDIRPMYFETFLQNWNFFIPANKVVKVNAHFPEDNAGKPAPLPVDISLYAAWPHSHQTCTGILNYAKNKNNDTIRLIKIPKWEFHWQEEYTYKSMVKIPQGYTLYSTHTFDNTANNPNTPDPNKPVLPGLFTEEEMLFDSYIFTFYKPGDENIDIASILAKDPLFNTTSTSDLDKTIFRFDVFPNPVISETNIAYSLLSAQFVSVSIYNVAGQEVKKLSSKIEASGEHTLRWDGTTHTGNKLNSGLYFVKIQAGSKVETRSVYVR